MQFFSLILGLGIGCTETGKTFSSGLYISHESIAFGAVPMGETVEETIVIENRGDLDFMVLSASLIEGSTNIFEVERDEDNELAGGESLNILVGFSPAAIEGYEGKIQIRSTLEESANIYVDISGEGSLSVTDNDNDGFTEAEGDCNDANGSVYPGAPEICDGLDSDCNGILPDDERDDDLDNVTICAGDCNDQNNAIRPGAAEICDDLDNDCDGLIQDRMDVDGDGITMCDNDCDDENDAIWPGNPEICDELDNDCSGEADDVDADGDGFGACTAGGDCDDNNPLAHPVILDPDAEFAGEGTPEFPYDNLADAINGMDNYCRAVAIFPGNYNLGLVWNNGHISLIGLGDSPNEVTITVGVDEDGNPLPGRHFQISDNSFLGLTNLTLSGGTGDGDGGSILAINSDLDLNHVRFVNNTSDNDGGAISITNGTLSTDNSTFRNNVAGDDGGAIAMFQGTLIDKGSTFRNNRGQKGGALLLEGSEADMSDTHFESNNATQTGGAMHFTGDDLLKVERAKVWLNASNTNGGGFNIVDHDNVDSYIRNTRFQDNLTSEHGAAIALIGDEAQMVVANNTFFGNSCSDNGAGIYVEATDQSSCDGLYIWSNIFHSNTGDNDVFLSPLTGGSVAYNSSFFNSNLVGYQIDPLEDDGQNAMNNDPLLVAYSNNGDPTDEDLTLMPQSHCINSGPTNGEGPSNYDFWQDFVSGDRNDRGFTGGQGGDQ